MADLTLQQRFGKDAEIVNESGNLVLKIRLSNLQDSSEGGDFTNGLGLSIISLDPDNPDNYATPISWALLQLARQNQPETNNDETVALYITNEGRRGATRNQVAQNGFRLVATAYQDDPVGIELDPDSIGTSS